MWTMVSVVHGYYSVEVNTVLHLGDVGGWFPVKRWHIKGSRRLLGRRAGSSYV